MTFDDIKDLTMNSYFPYTVTQQVLKIAQEYSEHTVKKFFIHGSKDYKKMAMAFIFENKEDIFAILTYCPKDLTSEVYVSQWSEPVRINLSGTTGGYVESLALNLSLLIQRITLEEASVGQSSAETLVKQYARVSEELQYQESIAQLVNLVKQKGYFNSNNYEEIDEPLTIYQNRELSGLEKHLSVVINNRDLIAPEKAVALASIYHTNLACNITDVDAMLDKTHRMWLFVQYELRRSTNEKHRYSIKLYEETSDFNYEPKSVIVEGFDQSTQALPHTKDAIGEWRGTLPELLNTVFKQTAETYKSDQDAQRVALWEMFKQLSKNGRKMPSEDKTIVHSVNVDLDAIGHLMTLWILDKAVKDKKATKK